MIPIIVTPATPNPATRVHALRYLDRELFPKSLDAELEKLHENGTDTWLKPAELGVLPKGTNIINLTVSFNYKRNRHRLVEEQKTRASIRASIRGE